MSERKIRKEFREGDPVILNEREGILQSLLSSQYFVLFEDGSGEFHFYNEGMLLKMDESRPRPKVKRARKKK